MSWEWQGDMKRANRVEAITREGLAAVEHAVVVDKEHVPALHGEVLDVLLRDLWLHSQGRRALT